MKVNIQNTTPDKMSTEELHQLTNSLQKVLGQNDESSDFFNTLVRLLALPEEQFALLSPGIIQSYQQSLNNPTDRMSLIYILNSIGGKAEDLTEAMNELNKLIDDTDLSLIKRESVIQ